MGARGERRSTKFSHHPAETRKIAIGIVQTEKLPLSPSTIGHMKNPVAWAARAIISITVFSALRDSLLCRDPSAEKNSILDRIQTMKENLG